MPNWLEVVAAFAAVAALFVLSLALAGLLFD